MTRQIMDYSFVSVSCRVFLCNLFTVSWLSVICNVQCRLNSKWDEARISRLSLYGSWCDVLHLANRCLLSRPDIQMTSFYLPFSCSHSPLLPLFASRARHHHAPSIHTHPTCRMPTTKIKGPYNISVQQVYSISSYQLSKTTATASTPVYNVLTSYDS